MNTPALATALSTQVTIPLDVAQAVLTILQTTTPRGDAHSNQLINIYDSMIHAVMSARAS